jgi:hypothetical protein
MTTTQANKPILQKVKEAIPGTAENKAAHTTAGTGYGANTTTTGTGYGTPTGNTGLASGAPTTGTDYRGTTTTEKVKEHMPGTAEYGARQTGYTGTKTTGATTTAVPATEVGYTTSAHEAHVCGQEKFTVVEDRPKVVEVKETWTEHRPVEREMVKEVRTTGNEKMLGVTREAMGPAQERIVAAADAPRCPQI